MFRKMRQEDQETFFSMTELFYESDAVMHPIPQKHHIDAFREMMRSDAYLEGYIFEIDHKPAGYAIITKTYSHEAGGVTIWIDELFVLEEYRSKGIGREFIDYLKTTLGSSVARLRLEVESENKRAVQLYQKMGFQRLEYDQMYMEEPN